MFFAKQVWKIIGHLGGFNGAALMESFSCTALHFITSVCQLHLIYKVSKGQRMWSINLWVGDCTKERGDGRIYHSLTWQDVLQLSLVELEWVISVITLIRNDLSQVYGESLNECARAWVTCKRWSITTSEAKETFVKVLCRCTGVTHRSPYRPVRSLCLHRWFVFTQGPIYMCY